MDDFLDIVRALGDRDRVRVVKLLQLGSLGITELAQVLDRSEADVRDLVSVLRDAELVISGDGESGEVFRVNPERKNLYGAVLLALMDGWFNEERDVSNDRRKMEGLFGEGE